VLVISQDIKTAINYFFYKYIVHNLPIFLIAKNLAEHWDLPNTEIFYSKDVASVQYTIAVRYSMVSKIT
jgi:hypothetical protein